MIVSPPACRERAGVQNGGMRIVLCYPVEPRHVAQIQAAAPAAEVVNAGQERVAAEIMRADIFCGHAKVPLPWDEVVRQGRLRWIQSSAAGMDHCLVPSVVGSDITVTSASGVLADQVAEHCVALLTGLLRNIRTFFNQQNAREFVRRPTDDLHRKRVGIVGFGGVGRRIAEVISPFKTEIYATDVFPIRKPLHVRELWADDRFSDLIQTVDVLIFSAPLTDKTCGMLNEKTIALLRPGAYVVNVARGPIVVERDLVAALRSGHLAGAALDVTEEEPLPETSVLWDLPNVIITPHVAGQSARRIDDMTDFFCDNLARYQSGRRLRNLLTDKQLGFPPPDLLDDGAAGT